VSDCGVERSVGGNAGRHSGQLDDPVGEDRPAEVDRLARRPDERELLEWCSASHPVKYFFSQPETV